MKTLEGPDGRLTEQEAEELRDRAQRAYQQAKKLPVSGVSVAHEYQVEVMCALGGQTVSVEAMARLMRTIAQRDELIEQHQQQADELRLLLAKNEACVALQQQALRELRRAEFGGLVHFDALPPALRELVQLLGDDGLVAEYAGQLQRAETSNTQHNGESPSLRTFSRGVSTEKVVIAVAQEVHRQGLEYKGCEISAIGDVSTITVRIAAKPGQSLDCAALQRAVARHMPVEQHLKIRAETLVAADISGS